jgi:hypothetical protein
MGPYTYSLFNYDPQFTSVNGTTAADYSPLADSLLGNISINFPDYFNATRCFPTMGAIEMPAPPGVAVVISGDPDVCPGETVTYSIDEVPYATNYAWTWPTGWTIISTPPYSYSITVVAGAVGDNGNITVEVTKGSCLPPDTGSLPVTVVALPVTGPIYHD